MRIQFALEALAENAPDLFADAARRQSERAVTRANEAMTIEHDRHVLAKRAEWRTAG
jgi:hypothetical protein